jgi:sugar phosphate isomerase/epimerase
MRKNGYSRRDFLGFSVSAPAAIALGSFAEKFFGGDAAREIPVGLELYTVRDGLKRDPRSTVRAVANMGYQCVEFYAPYFDWSASQTKDMRKLLDDVGMKCYSTHNSAEYFASGNLSRARDMNLTLGCKYMVMASSEEKTTLEQWKKLGDTLNAAAQTLEPSGLRVGYHNHAAEFTPLEGRRPMEVLAEATSPAVMLQLDVGTCLAAGADPVAWIAGHPGRIRSIHCKDWGPGADQGYRVLFGEGAVDWKAIFASAEHGGGVEYYLVEQEGSRFPELETAEKCLAAFRAARATA